MLAPPLTCLPASPPRERGEGRSFSVGAVYPMVSILTLSAVTRYRLLSKGARMRFLMTSLLVVCSVSAHARQTVSVERIGDCLVLPVAAVDNHVKAIFEVTLDNAGKVKSVTVVSYDPHSEAAAEAVQQLSKSVQECWLPGIKTSPMRITVDLSKT
ncbi:hypothetical protein [Mesorhizobium sp. M1322]|uniref:hypothetical protein n=1 Tax=Mesorhizobium sp. M1322 TaxID=2957081 RepID=UPI003339274B